MPIPRAGRALIAALLLVPAVAGPAAARPRRVVLHVPAFTVPAGHDREVCTAVRVPRTVGLDITGMNIVNVGANAELTSHHFLAYAFTGESAVDLAPVEGQALPCSQVKALDTNKLLIGGSQTVRQHQVSPPGLALRLEPVAPVPGKKKDAIWIILNAHWVNASTRVQKASVRVTLLRAPRHTVKRYLKPIFEVTANAGLDVAPHQVRSTEDSTKDVNALLASVQEPPVEDAWGPGRTGLERYGVEIGGALEPQTPACVTFLTAHMHKRGALFAVDFIDIDGQVHNGPADPELANPFESGRYHLFISRRYNEPAQIKFDPPRLLVPGQRFHYACWHDNGVTKPIKLGCEVHAGKTPGASIASTLGELAAPTPCTQAGPDPDECPPSAGFTGNCVEANLVFGYAADDDMCILPGAYYDANPDAPPGQECDLGLLPVLP